MARSSKQTRRVRKEQAAKAVKSSKAASPPADRDAPAKWGFSRDSFFPFRAASSPAPSEHSTSRPTFWSNRSNAFMAAMAGATIASVAALFYAVFYVARAITLRILTKSWVCLPLLAISVKQLVLVVLSTAVLAWWLPPIIVLPIASSQGPKTKQAQEHQQTPADAKRLKPGSYAGTSNKSADPIQPALRSHQDQQYTMQTHRQDQGPPHWQ